VGEGRRAWLLHHLCMSVCVRVRVLEWCRLCVGHSVLLSCVNSAGYVSDVLCCRHLCVLSSIFCHRRGRRGRGEALGASHEQMVG